jgi:hypothetical protein
MSANPTSRPSPSGRSLRLRVAAALLVAGSLPACTGDNLFTGLGAIAGLLGPEVEITAPQANFTLGTGDSLTVTANVAAPEGVTTVTFSGLFSGGTAAFTQVVVSNLPSPADTTITRRLGQVDATTGTVRVIVEATDALGDKGADTVSVIIQ